MKVTVSASATSDTRILFVDSKTAETIQDFEGKKETVAVRYKGKTTLIYAGLGSADDLMPRHVRATAAAAIRAAVDLKRTKVSLVKPALAGFDDAVSRAALEGAILGAYAFTKYKKTKPATVKSIEFVGKGISTAAAGNLLTICTSTWYARDLVNENANTVYPARLAREARALAKGTGITTKVLTDKDLKAKGLGLLSAVGRGSPYPPCLIIMQYNGSKRRTAPVAIVGKGITFDSGGQNLKPSGSIETMRGDMAGAAAVLGTMKVIAERKPGIHVIGVVAAAHNAIDGASYIPGDIHRAYDGTTVEIRNTDAEGRLALADAIAYVVKHYRPGRIIDLATLTGGVLSALGTTIAGILGNDDELAGDLFAAGERSGERLWRLPLYEEHEESMKGDLADMRNISSLPRGHASTITGAAFIKAFVKDTPWAHIDIAGTAFNKGEVRGEVPKNGTGFGVRLLCEYLGL